MPGSVFDLRTENTPHLWVIESFQLQQSEALDFKGEYSRNERLCTINGDCDNGRSGWEKTGSRMKTRRVFYALSFGSLKDQ